MGKVVFCEGCRSPIILKQTEAMDEGWLCDDCLDAITDDPLEEE